MSEITLTHNKPAAYTQHAANAYGVVYFTESPKPAAIAFRGKGAKSVWHYQFLGKDGLERMQRTVNDFLTDLEKSAQEKAERRAVESAYDARSDFAPGDIVVNTWGWEQTNIDFYEVESVTSRFVTVRPIAAKITPDNAHAMSGTSLPVPLSYAGKSERHHVKSDYNGQLFIKFEHGSGHKWDGRAERCTWYG